MEQAKKSGFKFINHRIYSTLLEIPQQEEKENELRKDDQLDLKISFNPKGKFYKNESIFLLDLGCIIKNDTEDIRMEIGVMGKFELGDENILHKTDNYFCTNAPAIIFPYIRAYISTLTSLSGLKPILLPTLNLVGMGEILKENIEIIE